jgi:hypothetical protein
MEERLSLPQDRTNHVATNLEDEKNIIFTHKPPLFLPTQHRCNLIYNVPLNVYYMFRPVLRPSSDMSIKNIIKEDILK